MSNPEQRTTRDWATGLIAGRYWLFAAAVIATGFCWGPATRLKSDQSVGALFAKNDPRVVAFLRSQAIFGGDELAFFCYTDPKLNTESGMSRLRDLSQELGEVAGIRTESVQDLASSLDQARLPFINIPPNQFRELTHRVLIGDDGITTAIVLRFAPLRVDDVATGDKRDEVVLATVPRLQTIQQVREVGKRFFEKTGLEPYLVGEPVQEWDALQYTEIDDEWLWIYTAALMQLLLLCYFVDLRWMLLPSMAAFVGLVWTRAILVFHGVHLGMISSMLTPMLTIIGVVLLIPIAIKFREHRVSEDPKTALAATFRELGSATLLATIVIALGCLALMTSEIYPLAEFGWMIGIGTLMLLPAAICLLPFSSHLGTRTAQLRPRAPVDIFHIVLRHLLQRVEAAPVSIALVALGLVLFGVVGCFRVQIETDFIKNFRPSSPIAVGLDFVERHFGGSATWEVNFPTPDEMSDEFIDQAEQLAVELRSLQVQGRPALTKVICLADGEAIVPRTFFTSELSRRLWLLDKLQAEYVSTLYNAEEKRMRLILRSLERQSSREKLEIIRRVTEVSRKHFPQAETTGIFVLLTFLIEDLLRDQWISLAAAAGCISVTVTLAFRKLVFGLICLIPNLCSIVIVVGTIGWMGYPINIATAMVACMSLGIMTASTIQYLSAFRQSRAAGEMPQDSIRDAYLRVGWSAILGNFAMISGFLVLTSAHFIPVIYFGIMTSVTLLGGLIGNLCLLPLFLRLAVDRKSPPARAGAV